MKKCTKCGVEKPFSEFTRRRASKDGCAPRCKLCSAAVRRADYARDVEKGRAVSRRGYVKNPRMHLAAQKVWKQNNPDYHRDYSLRANYGISLAQYQDMLLAQNSVCAICHSPDAGGAKKRYHVDHDHATGAIRGLLCNTCNLMLGTVQDQPSVLRNAARYLEPALPVLPGY